MRQRRGGPCLREPRDLAPDKVAVLSRAVTSELIAGGGSSASCVDRLISADVSTNAEEDQGQKYQAKKAASRAWQQT